MWENTSPKKCAFHVETNGEACPGHYFLRQFWSAALPLGQQSIALSGKSQRAKELTMIFTLEVDWWIFFWPTPLNGLKVRTTGEIQTGV